MDQAGRVPDLVQIWPFLGVYATMTTIIGHYFGGFGCKSWHSRYKMLCSAYASLVDNVR